jgi:hypothetical protein
MAMDVLTDKNLLRHICSFQRGRPLDYWLLNIDRTCEHGYLNILKCTPASSFNVTHLQAAIFSDRFACATYILDACPRMKGEYANSDPMVYYKLIDLNLATMFLWVLNVLQVRPPGDVVDYLLSRFDPRITNREMCGLIDQTMVLKASVARRLEAYVIFLIQVMDQLRGRCPDLQVERVQSLEYFLEFETAGRKYLPVFLYNNMVAIGDVLITADTYTRVVGGALRRGDRSEPSEHLLLKLIRRGDFSRAEIVLATLSDQQQPLFFPGRLISEAIHRGSISFLKKIMIHYHIDGTTRRGYNTYDANDADDADANDDDDGDGDDDGDFMMACAIDAHDLDMIKFLHEIGCGVCQSDADVPGCPGGGGVTDNKLPVATMHMDYAAKRGFLAALAYMSSGGSTCTSMATYNAAINGHMGVLSFLHRHGYARDSSLALQDCINLDLFREFKWLHTHNYFKYSPELFNTIRASRREDQGRYINYLITHKESVDVVIRRQCVSLGPDVVRLLDDDTTWTVCSSGSQLFLLPLSLSLPPPPPPPPLPLPFPPFPPARTM